VPKFYGELQEASLENLSSDPSGTVAGKVWHNTTEVRVKTDDGTNKRALLRNDAYCLIGNHGTPANNIRLHRGASEVLQFVPGNNATAEGTLATTLAQISAQVENYTDSGKPAAGNAGRIAFITDLLQFLGDNGVSWVPLGGGGGGSSMKWEEDAEAPIRLVENGVGVYLFADAVDAYLYTAIRVPTSYAASRPVSLKISIYDPSESGTVLMNTVATLIRNGTDAITSTTNQRTSTNAALTLGAGSLNEPNSITLDLTSTTGTINSVAIAAGDLILVKLTRAYGSDTSTGDVRFIEQSSEVLFS
jgi:hypothetical protein